MVMTMDYEQKYKEALEKARKELQTCGSKDCDAARQIYRFFPELQKSEDEKIRKELIEHIKANECANYVLFQKFSPDNVIAWLEKQGQEKHLSEPIKDYQGSFTCWNNAHDFRPKHLQRCICYDKYMGGVYCYVYDDISKYWCTQTTEEHDSDGDNHISDYADYRITLWMPLPDASFYPSKSLLEKQGEFKSSKWTEGDVVRHGGVLALVTNGRKAMKSNCEQITIQYPDEWVKAETKERKHFFEELEKQGEQKPIANVEPKFKVKYAGSEYNVFETKDIAGVTFYGIEDEPNHIDYVKAENCEIISVYAIKENGSPYPTKPAVFSEKKPKRMISAEAKEAM